MSNHLPNNYFDDNMNGYYNSFDGQTGQPYVNSANALLATPPMGPQTPVINQSYGQQNPLNASRRPNGSISSDNPKNNTHNYYRRTQPYYGQKPAASLTTGGNQYRAQVIDYTNGGQPQQPVRPYQSKPTANTSLQQSPAQRPPSGLLPHPVDSRRPYGQPSRPQFTGNGTRRPAPSANHVLQPNQPFHPLSQSQPSRSHPTIGNFCSPTDQTLGYLQTAPQPVPPPPSSVPKPVPPPTPSQSPLFPIASPTAAQRQANQMSTTKAEPPAVLSDEMRVQKLTADGMERRIQNDCKGFYCHFCEVFCINLDAAERHVETPKHHRTKIGDNLKGIDAKFTIKSDRISETRIALARKNELNKISNVIKNEYFNEGIRLKDGIGPNAYYCENCGISIASLVLVSKHLELHKQLTEQLRVCSKPVVGLDFVCEYIDPDADKPRVYECTLCRTFTTSNDIISHVCSYTHRTNFIKRIHPKEGQTYTSETQELVLEAGKLALELEMIVGRGQFKVKHQSAPANCFLTMNSDSLNKIQTNYIDLCETPPPTDRPMTTTITLATSPSPTRKPVFQIEIPKAKADEDKSSLERLFSVRLESETDETQVTKLIETITRCLVDYATKDMTADQRQRFVKQINSDSDHKS